MISAYHQILCDQIPDFIKAFCEVPSFIRLKGVGLNCGVDYSCFFHPSCYYSRYDHSLGVALITWHFTKNKAAAIAALYHDLSTPLFSHAIDFKNKDYLTQESTQKDNVRMIQEDPYILSCLQTYDITLESILHYEDYPVCDLPTPCLCADRLEYMLAQALFLNHTLTLEEVTSIYKDIEIQENGELGFQHQSMATLFFKASFESSKLYLEPFDKMTLQLLASIVERAANLHLIKEEDIYQLSEDEAMKLFKNSQDVLLQDYLWLLENQNEVVLSDKPLPHSFYAKFKVKRRYINPLVNNVRLFDLDQACLDLVETFVSQEDDQYYMNLKYRDL